MPTQTPKNSSQKKGGSKTAMDSEVTRVVLIFLLLLVIIALLVAAFMSLGSGADSVSTDSRIVIMMDGDNTSVSAPPETTSPNHGNAETEPIPDAVLDPENATEILQQPTMGEEETVPAVVTEPVSTLVTTTGTRPANTSPVYIYTTEIATLAPPLTTAYDPDRVTTVTTTVANNDYVTEAPVQEDNTPSGGDGTITNTNYTVSLSGSAGIYSSPGGSSAGTIGSNGTFTIVQEMTDSNGVKWGKLKSGAGWVRLN